MVFESKGMKIIFLKQGRGISRKLFTKVLSKTALRVGFVFILSYTSRNT